MQEMQQELKMSNNPECVEDVYKEEFLPHLLLSLPTFNVLILVVWMTYVLNVMPNTGLVKDQPPTQQMINTGLLAATKAM